MKLEIFKQSPGLVEDAPEGFVYNWMFSERGKVLATGKGTAKHNDCKRTLIAFIKKIQADDFTVYDTSVDVRPRRINNNRVRRLLPKR